MQMTKRTLGLDIGTNSVGWALIESRADGTVGKVLGIGSRIFPEGVDRDTQGAEHSKNEQRRIARGMRRQIARRARRKAVLRRALIVAGLLPAEAEAQRRLDDLDPYTLRSDGLTRKLEPHEIGRVLVHLNQRRGFLSNRKADRGRAKENEGLLKEINELAAEMGDRTLGQHFASKLAASQTAGQHEGVRGKHTRREMYLDEFRRLWEFQQIFHPQLLTDELRYGRRGVQQYPREPKALQNRKSNSLLQEFGLYGILFFQRSLYWPKSVIGRCELTGEKRCPRADRLAQRFRLLNEVNNLRILPEYDEPRPLTEDERATLIGVLSTKKERTFGELRKALGLLDSDAFNLERADRKKLLGSPIDVALAHKELFAKAWDRLPEETKNAVVRSLLDDEEDAIRRKAVEEWGCSPELAEKLVDFDPTAITDGYASYSRSAMERLLPHLERGLRLMANDASDSALHAAGYLRPDQKAVRQSDRLPDVPREIMNPIVRQGMYEVRKLVHAIIREFGKPDAIHIELAREAKGNAEQRAKRIQDMRDNERRRDAAAAWLRERNFKPTHEAIQRYLLWKEQNEECVYSGRNISPAQLLGGEVDIDHILPYSKSLDNSLMNKVVAFRSENTRKGQQTPYQWLAEQDPEKYARVLQQARKLLFAKRQRFSQKKVELDDFLQRQLSDTAYITTCVRQYLLHLGTDIVCTKGQSTAELRRLWGLNGVLRDDGLNLKSRDDHRHHAVDALVIALTDRSRLQQLARTQGTNDERLPPPWADFREQVAELADGIKVSHRAARKIAGALHKETIYGPTSKPQFQSENPRPHAQSWIEEPGTFVIRKSLESLTPAMVDDIRDPHVRSLVISRLREFDIDHMAKGAKIHKDVWIEPIWMLPKSGKQSEHTHRIKYVRVLVRDQTIKPIRGGTACVKPGNTHHISLFELPGSSPEKPKRDMIAVTMLEAVERQKQGDPLISHAHPTIPDARFLFSLSWGELIWATIRGREDLYVFRTAASTTKQMSFSLHTDARPDATREKFTAKPSTLNGVKVTIDLLGRIRDAHD
jgi:CRISPR-associated endonuclease Csn1